MRTDEAENIELRFLLPSKVIGLIIGKNGDNIRKLRKKYPIRFRISENTGSERTLNLEGESSIVFDALEAILQRLLTTQEENILDLRLLVHNSHAGIIIGKGGVKIKEFRENSGLKTLKVYQELCPNSTDRVVQIVGELDVVILFIQSVSEIIKFSQPKGNVSNYDAGNYDELNSHAYGGWSQNDGGSGGPISNNSKRNRYDNDASPNFSYYTPNKNSMPKYNHSGNSGGPNAGSPNMMNDVFGSRMHSNQHQSGLGSNGHLSDPNLVADMMRAGMPNRMGMSINLNPTTTTQVSISDKMIGAIMGKGGTRINQVRRESGADIKINKHERDVEDRIITITGTPDQIQNAQFLLQVCVKKYGDVC